MIKFKSLFESIADDLVSKEKATVKKAHKKNMYSVPLDTTSDDLHDMWESNDIRSGILQNTSPLGIKSLLNRDVNNQARFLITPEGKLHAGSSGYIHSDIHDLVHGSYNISPGHIFGYAAKIGSKYYFGGGTHDSKRGFVPLQHPMYKEFEKHGFKQGVIIPHSTVRKPKKGETPNSVDLEESINEMTQKKVLQYINATQDKERYSDMNKINQRLNSFVLAQKKVGISRTKPKVMATKEGLSFADLFEMTRELKATYVGGIEKPIYHDTTPSHLMALTKNHGTHRFVIDNEDKLHVGKAEDFIHGDLAKLPPEPRDFKARIRGEMTHINGKHYFDYTKTNSTNDHPLIAKMKNYGAIKGHRVGDWDFLEVKPNEIQPKKVYNKADIESIYKNLKENLSFKALFEKTYNSEIDHVFTHKEKELGTPERTKILKKMTPGQSQNYDVPDSNVADNLTEAVKSYRSNPSLIKDIARNSKAHEARFVIDNEDRLHAGDAYNVYHAQIMPHNKTKIVGYVSYLPQTNAHKYIAFKSKVTAQEKEQEVSSKDHPILTTFEKEHGIKKSKDWDAYTKETADNYKNLNETTRITFNMNDIEEHYINENHDQQMQASQRIRPLSKDFFIALQERLEIGKIMRFPSLFLNNSDPEKQVHVAVNPTEEHMNRLHEMMNKGDKHGYKDTHFRIISHRPTGNHYIWPSGQATHHDVIDNLKLHWKDIDSSYIKSEGVNSKNYKQKHIENMDKYLENINENISFKSLFEELTPNIYHGITPQTLMDLSRQHGTTRFIIDQKNNIHAGNATHFTHTDIDKTFPHEDVDFGEEINKSEGEISHNNDTNQWYYSASKNHPKLDQLEAKGVKKGKRVGDYENLHVMPIKEASIEQSSVYADQTPNYTDRDTNAPIPLRKRRKEKDNDNTPDERPNSVNFKDTFNEGKVELLHAPWSENSIKVYHNPTKEQAKRMTGNFFRGVKDEKGNHYIANADDTIHYDIQRHFGLKNYHNLEGSFFDKNQLKKNGYDVGKTHSQTILDDPDFSRLDEGEYEDIMYKQREKEGLMAALKHPDTGEIYLGKTHADAYENAPAEVKPKLYSYIDQKNKNFSRASIAGFVDSKNKWLTRKDAEKLSGNRMLGGNAEGLRHLGYMKD